MPSDYAWPFYPILKPIPTRKPGSNGFCDMKRILNFYIKKIKSEPRDE